MAADERNSIHNSSTYRAMSLEVRVAGILESNGWNTAHSAWYRDMKEQKDRELDVDAIRSWQHQRGEEIDYVRLHILAECKSVKGGQILFARQLPSLEETLYFHWLDADDETTCELLRETMIRRGVKDRAAAQAIRRFLEATYPEGESLVSRLIPSPPSAANHVSAGQEVIHKEKDNDNKSPRRYLWEASQAVYGAIDNTTAELFAYNINEVGNRVPHSAGDQRLVEECVQAMTSEAETLTIFHPVVVTDANLWAFEPEGEPEPIPSCRVTQIRIATRLQRWIDIVHEDEFAAWAERTTRWYLDAFASDQEVSVTASRGRGSPSATSGE